jgi:hypothetical protein
MKHLGPINFFRKGDKFCSLYVETDMSPRKILEELRAYSKGLDYQDRYGILSIDSAKTMVRDGSEFREVRKGILEENLRQAQRSMKKEAAHFELEGLNSGVNFKFSAGNAQDGFTAFTSQIKSYPRKGSEVDVVTISGQGYYLLDQLQLLLNLA